MKTSDFTFWRHPLKWLEREADDFDLQSAASGVVSWVEDALNSLSVADWVLVAIAFGLVSWVIASLRAVTRLGPVEVQELEHDGPDAAAAPVKALTAQLREALSRSGLSPPPAVPAGTPQINLLDAIKASPIPDANWIATLVQLIPRPRPSEYKISGVMTGTESSGPPWQLPEPCGIRYSVVPAGSDGSADLDTVPGCDTFGEAITAASSRMYLHISQDATGAFPMWARWHNASALEAFVESWDLREDDQLQQAMVRLEEAQSAEPFNALATLQIANLYERSVPAQDVGSELRRARVLALAVSRYLDVADAWPEVVEARYRLSVAADALASALDALGEADAEEILRYLPLPKVDSVPALQKRLRYIAKRECSAILQLLRPWHALLNDLRLRTQFEPKGFQRRELRRTVSISRHLHGMRQLVGRTDRRAQVQICWRWTMVHLVHLGIGRGTASWQAHYNAALFNALLWDHYLQGGA
jgi:hypothetical protein